jgi:hypothetical protein
MSRATGKLAVFYVLFCLEFIPSAFFADGILAARTLHVSPLLTSAPKSDAAPFELGSPAEADGRFGFERYGEPTRRAGDFLTERNRPRLIQRSLPVVPRLFRITLAPKVSRCIRHSVLNI